MVSGSIAIPMADPVRLLIFRLDLEAPSSLGLKGRALCFGWVTIWLMVPLTLLAPILLIGLTGCDLSYF